jgi:hypothetical protein
MLRARHRDLETLSPERAWAEHMLVREHLARLIHTRRRRLRIVRRDGHNLIDELQWCEERIPQLERCLARRGRVA